MAATEYLVLVQHVDDAKSGALWATFGKYEAASADAAIRAAALEHGDGTYVATPARSWQPRTVATKTAVTFAKEEA